MMSARWIIASLVFLSVGCSGQHFATAPVSGTVTLNGEPLAGAHVSFEPVSSSPQSPAGPGSYGRTDEAGHFSLRLVDDDRRGAVVGLQVVRITTALDVDPSSDASGTQPEQVPPRFRDGSERVTVPAEGLSDLQFNLQTAPASAR